MSRTLIDITEDMQALDDLLDMVGGDVTDPAVASAIEEWFAELDTDLKNKVDGYAGYIAAITARAEFRDAEANRLRKLAGVDLNAAKYLKDRLKFVFENRPNPIQRVDTPHYRVSIARNGGVVPLDIYDPKAVPREFCRHIPESWEPDGDLIRKALSEGKEVAGVVAQTRGTHLRIA